MSRTQAIETQIKLVVLGKQKGESPLSLSASGLLPASFTFGAVTLEPFPHLALSSLV